MLRTPPPQLDRTSHKNIDSYCEQCEVKYPCDAERLFRYVDNLHTALENTGLIAIPFDSPDNYEWNEDVPLQLAWTKSPATAYTAYGTTNFTHPKLGSS